MIHQAGKSLWRRFRIVHEGSNLFAGGRQANQVKSRAADQGPPIRLSRLLHTLLLELNTHPMVHEIALFSIAGFGRRNG